MDSKEAIEVIRSNWPSSNYTMLIEALELSIKSLQAAESAQTGAQQAKVETVTPAPAGGMCFEDGQGDYPVCAGICCYYPA